MSATDLGGTSPSYPEGQPGSPIWWVNRLNWQLMLRRPRYELLDLYYRGKHRLPESDERARDHFKQFQRKSRANYMKMVADSVNERLRVVGFRTGAQGSSDTDGDAWRVWQANHLDADQGLVHIAALKYPDAYAIVGPPQKEGGDPIITVEDPRQVIGEADPIDRRSLRAAVKTWVDDVAGKRMAILYLPDRIYYFSSPYANDMELVRRSIGVEMAPYVAPQGAWEQSQPSVPNPIGIVPVVRFVAQPMEDGEGIGEFEDLIDVQDRINDTILNRMIITKMQAYQQRWVKGIDTKDEDGNDIDMPFVPGVDMLWAVADPDVEFGQFEPSDIGPLLNAVRADVEELVVRAALPPTYVMGQVVNVSADAVAAIEERLVAKVRSRASQLGESWEQVMRLAFTYLGQPTRIAPDAEVQWTSAERQTLSTLATSAVALSQAGVPWREVMAKIGYTPSQIDRMQTERVTDAMMSALKAPTPASPQQPGNPEANPEAEPKSNPEPKQPPKGNK